ncbi:hypothetical protein BN19_091 [Streptococcus phage SP-QS1]|uniref:Uncharacterized protein n=1 Tax=Streptococcus phage SP-QS1 TaxID=1208587 RepID=S6CQD8_9CAUD|nr:hypothetical protein BN19_091 [Streptococcus phage SP-QS1]CCJ09744.1 hypothetical protein BN19_091 [Streptococcus phage SP-QS1]
MPCDGLCVPCLVSVLVKAFSQPHSPPLHQARRDSIPQRLLNSSNKNKSIAKLCTCLSRFALRLRPLTPFGYPLEKPLTQRPRKSFGIIL